MTGALTRYGSLTFSSGCCGGKNKQTNKHEKKKSPQDEMWQQCDDDDVGETYCVFLFGQAGFGTLRSAAVTLMRMDVLEMRILHEEVIHDILFYFFPPSCLPFSFCLHLRC